jgi:hypothetical protein
MNVKAQLSGKIGCNPEEVEIGESKGYMTSSVTKVTCRGRTYLCSKTVRTGNSFGTQVNGQNVSPTWSTITSEGEFSCAAEDGGERSAPMPGQRGAPPVAHASAKATTEAPSGAGGFIFGSEEATVSKQCADAKRKWERIDANRAQCSGTVVDIGMDASSRLKFCDGKLCSVVLRVSFAGPTPNEWVGQYRDLLVALVRKYGPVASKSTALTDDCSDNLRACLDAGDRSLEAWWRWSDGHAIHLVLGRVEGDPGLAVVYEDRAQKKGQPKLEGL